MNYMDYDMGAYEGTHKKIIRYLKSEKGRDYAEWIKAFDVNI